MGICAVGLLNCSGALQLLQDKVLHKLRLSGNNRTHLALVDAFNYAVHDKRLANQTKDTVKAGGNAKFEGRACDYQHIADHKRLADLQRGMFCQDQGHNIRTARGCADIKDYRAAHCRQQHCKYKLQQCIAGKRCRKRPYFFKQRYKK